MATRANTRVDYFQIASGRLETTTAALTTDVAAFVLPKGSATPTPSAGCTLTANPGSFNSPTYAWYTVTGGVETLISGQTAATLAVTASAFQTLVGSGTSGTYRVKISQTGFITKVLDQTIYYLREGADGTAGASGIVITVGNETAVLPSTADGTVTGYTNSATYVRVFEGATELTYNGTGASAGTYTISLAGSNITAGGVSGTVIGSVTAAGIAAASGMTVGSDVATITITITGKNSAGTSFSQTKTQRITKSKSTVFYDIIASAPVLVKDAVDAATSGTYTSISIQGKKYDGTTTTNYGWITVTGNGDVEAGTATDTSSSPFTLSPISTAGKGSYVLKMYNQATVSGATLLDSQTIPVTFKGTTGANGTSPVVADLSNDAVVLSADTGGVVASYAGSGTTIQVFEGSTALTYLTTLGTTASAFTISSTTLSPTASITIGSYSGNSTTTATVGAHSAMSQDNVTITYGITYNRANGTSGTTYITQSLAKSKVGNTGAAGTSSKSVDLTVSTQTFTYTSSGATPSPSSTIFTATVQNATAGSTAWYDFLVAGTSVQNTTTNTYTYTPQASYASMPQQVTVKYRENGAATSVLATDIVSMFGIKPGVDGISPVVGYLTNEAVVVDADVNGTVSSFASAAGVFRVFDGTTDKTGNAAVTYSVQSTTAVSISIASTGTYTVTALSAGTGSAILRALYNGVTIDCVYSIAKSRTGATGQEGTKSAYASAYIWATATPTIASTAATYTWSTNTASAYPASWSSSPSASPGVGYNLYQASLYISATLSATTTSVNWNTATIGIVGFSGLQGDGARIAYTKSTSNTFTGTATSSGSTSLPVATDFGMSGLTWATTPPTLSTAGEMLFQTNGVYVKATDTITWQTPYLSNLKVGQLSAITANMGSLTSGIITTQSSGTARIVLDGLTAGDTNKGLYLYNASNALTGKISVDGSGYFGAGSGTAGLIWDTAGNVSFAGTLVANLISASNFKFGDSSNLIGNPQFGFYSGTLDNETLGTSLLEWTNMDTANGTVTAEDSVTTSPVTTINQSSRSYARINHTTSYSKVRLRYSKLFEAKPLDNLFLSAQVAWPTSTAVVSQALALALQRYSVGDVTYPRGKTIIQTHSVDVVATANVTVSSPGTAISGVTLAEGKLVLLTKQTTSAENGIYVYRAFNNTANPTLSRASSLTQGYQLIDSCIYGLNNTTFYKAYLCDQVAAASAPYSVRVVATSNINTATPGTTIDGVTLASGNYILLKAQTNSDENGIWSFNTSSTALTRVYTVAQLVESNISVTAGSVYTGAYFKFSNSNLRSVYETSTVTIGTTPLMFITYTPAASEAGGVDFGSRYCRPNVHLYLYSGKSGYLEGWTTLSDSVTLPPNCARFRFNIESSIFNSAPVVWNVSSINIKKTSISEQTRSDGLLVSNTNLYVNESGSGSIEAYNYGYKIVQLGGQQTASRLISAEFIGTRGYGSTAVKAVANDKNVVIAGGYNRGLYSVIQNKESVTTSTGEVSFATSQTDFDSKTHAVILASKLNSSVTNGFDVTIDLAARDSSDNLLYNAQFSRSGGSSLADSSYATSKFSQVIIQSDPTGSKSSEIFLANSVSTQLKFWRTDSSGTVQRALVMALDSDDAWHMYSNPTTGPSDLFGMNLNSTFKELRIGTAIQPASANTASFGLLPSAITTNRACTWMPFYSTNDGFTYYIPVFKV